MARESSRAEGRAESVDRLLVVAHAAFWWASAVIFSTLIWASPALGYDLVQAALGGALLAAMGVVSSLVAGFPRAALLAPQSVVLRTSLVLLLWFGVFAGYTYRFGGSSALVASTLVPTLVLMIVLLGSWAAVALLVQSAIAREGQALRVERALADVREQRLARLRSQLAPHFICNALNAIATRVDEAPRAAQRMLADLGDLVRDALQDPGDRGTVRDELTRLEPYLQLERARFEDQLALELAAAPEVLDHDLPPLLLQPLVENAIRHGTAAPGHPLAVRIELCRGAGGELVASVTNPGRLGASARPGQGVGVENVRRRLRELYPGRHELALFEDQGRVVASLRLWDAAP